MPAGRALEARALEARALEAGGASILAAGLNVCKYWLLFDQLRILDPLRSTPVLELVPCLWITRRVDP